MHNAFKGKAWEDAELLETAGLDRKDGARILMRWIKENFMKDQGSEAGRILTAFFKKLEKLDILEEVSEETKDD